MLRLPLLPVLILELTVTCGRLRAFSFVRSVGLLLTSLPGEKSRDRLHRPVPWAGGDLSEELGAAIL